MYERTRANFLRAVAPAATHVGRKSAENNTSFGTRTYCVLHI
jgi:hypothetical protein